MENKVRISPLILALGLVLGTMSMTMGTVHAQPIVSSEAGDGSVELSNISGTGDQVPVLPEPSEVAGAATVKAETEAKQTEPPKDPREVYRDQVLKVSEEPQGATTAVSRRYKKMDKSTYNELLKSGALQPSQ